MPAREDFHSGRFPALEALPGRVNFEATPPLLMALGLFLVTARGVFLLSPAERRGGVDV
jgi:hypothetical protein